MPTWQLTQMSRGAAGPLVCLDLCRPHDFFVALDIALDLLAQRLGGAPQQIIALRRRLRLDLFTGQLLIDGFIQLFDDGLGRARRRKHTKPDVDVVAWEVCRLAY